MVEAGSSTDRTRPVASRSAMAVAAVARELLTRDPERLVTLVEQQARRIEEQSQEVADRDQQIVRLQGQIAELEERFEALERQSKRGAAPFGRPEDKRKKDRKRSGRKGGHKGRYRERPKEEQIDRQIEAPLEVCPDCGGSLEQAERRAVEQTIIEVPPVKPELIRLTTYRCRCPACDRQVSSIHPLQVSMASGAAGTHLGPRVLALAASLNKGLGLTMRKTCQALRQLLGLSLTPGGLSQALARMAGRLTADYQALLGQVKSRAVLYTDETSWWVGEPSYSLWVLTNDAGTYYRVVSSRSRAEALDLVGGDYLGVLVSDCLNIYDDLTVEQHKCYAHHLKAISQAAKSPAAQGSAYLLELRGLLLGAMALKAARDQFSAQQVHQMRAALEKNAEHLLARPRIDPRNPEQARQEEKVRQRLAKQWDHLFTFLDHDEVEATNNRAERQLRPAVISRKVSCGNKTERGMRTWETLASLAATCQQKGLSFVNLVAERMPLQGHIQPIPLR